MHLPDELKITDSDIGLNSRGVVGWKRAQGAAPQPKGWIGVDLDGTLAHYTHYQGPTHIGPPVPAMVERVKRWLAEGHDVRIFTARVACFAETDDPHAVFSIIEEWCIKHIGQELPITCIKDSRMWELWDDRAVQVIPNTGMPVGASSRGLG